MGQFKKFDDFLNEKVTIKDLEAQLKSMDWTYMMSDDPRAYKAGIADWETTNQMIQDLDKAGKRKEAEKAWKKLAPNAPMSSDQWKFPLNEAFKADTLYDFFIEGNITYAGVDQASTRFQTLLIEELMARKVSRRGKRNRHAWLAVENIGILIARLRSGKLQFYTSAYEHLKDEIIELDTTILKDILSDFGDVKFSEVHRDGVNTLIELNLKSINESEFIDEEMKLSRKNFLKLIRPLKVFIKNNQDAKEDLYDIIKKFYGENGVEVFESDSFSMIRDFTWDRKTLSNDPVWKAFVKEFKTVAPDAFQKKPKGIIAAKTGFVTGFGKVAGFESSLGFDTTSKLIKNLGFKYVQPIGAYADGTEYERDGIVIGISDKNMMIGMKIK